MILWTVNFFFVLWLLLKERESVSCSVMSDSLQPHGLLHGILQARILEWVAILFSRGSSQPRDQIRVSHMAGRLLTIWATGMPLRRVWENIILEAGELGRGGGRNRNKLWWEHRRAKAQKTLNKNAEPQASLSFPSKMSSLDSTSKSVIWIYSFSLYLADLSSFSIRYHTMLYVLRIRVKSVKEIRFFSPNNFIILLFKGLLKNDTRFSR